MAAQLQVKKMKQGMSYSCKEKTIILNVFKYFRIQFPEKCVTDIVRRTSKATGCSEKSIFQFRKEEASVEGFREPSKTKIRKNININSRDIKYDNNVRQSIRSIIYDLKYRGVIPSLNTILKQVNSDDCLPSFSLMTLRRLMFDMGFYYEKNGNKSVLTEKSIENKDNVQKVVPIASNQSNINLPKEVLPMMARTNCEIPPSNNIQQYMNHQASQRPMPMHVPHHNTNIMPQSHGLTYHNVIMNNTRDLLGPHTVNQAASGHHIKLELPPWMIK